MAISTGSTFADDADWEAYKKAIAMGATEEQALAVGDNRKGAWGDYTGKGSGPIVALPPGPGVYHNRPVIIKGPGGSVVARIGDKGPKGRIDLNPDAAAAVGHPGGLTPIEWSFADGATPPSPQVSLGDNQPVSLAPPSRIPAIFNTDLGSPMEIPEIATTAQTTPAGAFPDEEGIMSTEEGGAPVAGGGELNPSAGMQIIPRPPVPRNARLNSTGGAEWDDGHGGTIVVPSRDSDKAYRYTTPTDKKAYRYGPDKNGQLFERGQDGKWHNVTPPGAATVRTYLTPSEQMSQRRLERQTYTDNTATTMLYGKGQMPGLYQIKNKLDALYNQVGGDYSKLSPQAQAAFVFQYAKLNDPASAVLQGEYNAAANRLGIADRFKLAVDKAKRGDVLSTSQLADIQQTINTTYEQFKNDHFADLEQREPQMKELGLSLQKLGVPTRMISEYEQWKKEKGAEGGGATPTPTPTPMPPNVVYEAIQQRLNDSDPEKRKRAEMARDLMRQRGEWPEGE